MSSMFWGAASFNGDISKWNVSRVINMDNMFRRATSFKHRLCSAAWVHSNASQNDMFLGSFGSISQTVCTTIPSAGITKTTAFLPRSKSQLKSAIDECLKLPPKGICSKGPHGPIRGWDVSGVTNMSNLYAFSNFNGVISKWDVSRVIVMNDMFRSAPSFSGDISKWDVSRVTDMNGMFWNAKTFNGDISKWDVSRAVSYTHLTLPTNSRV